MTSRSALPLAALLSLVWVALAAPRSAAAQAAAPRLGAAVLDGAREAPWCIEEEGIEALTETLCHYSPEPPQRSPKTLVIFLHGLTKLGTTWQHNGQRGLARAAKANGFEVIMPRGRLGAGSSKYADHWNWPGSVAGQQSVEDEVLDEWLAAKRTLEERNGKPFERVYVFGFSAGAYYAASLALRGRLGVDGYGVFAGGGAPKGVERWAKGTQPKTPIYVGYGHKDKARRDPQRLGRALRAMGWKHRVVGRKNVGHSMTDAQIREALRFLDGKPADGSRQKAKPARPPVKKSGRRARPRQKS